MRRAVAAEIGCSMPSMRACPIPLTERVEVEAYHHRGLDERRDRLRAAQRVPGDIGERVDLDLRNRARVVDAGPRSEAVGLTPTQHVAHEASIAP